MVLALVAAGSRSASPRTAWVIGHLLDEIAAAACRG
jgi:hypothetical protein